MAAERAGIKRGQCPNPKCEKNGETIELTEKEPFLCPCCGKRLIPVKTGGDGPKIPWAKIAIAGAVVVGVACAIIFWPKDNSTKPPQPPECDTCFTPGPGPDPEPVIEDPIPDDYQKSFRYYISYGIYKGEISDDGYAEGQGEFIFTKRHLINENDVMYKRMAEKDWRVVGTFYHGFFTNGRLYKSDGEFEVLNIGKTANAESVYGEKLKERSR